MILSPHIFLYASLFVFDKSAFGQENAPDVEAETAGRFAGTVVGRQQSRAVVRDGAAAMTSPDGPRPTNVTGLQSAHNSSESGSETTAAAAAAAAATTMTAVTMTAVTMTTTTTAVTAAVTTRTTTTTGEHVVAKSGRKTRNLNATVATASTRPRPAAAATKAPHRPPNAAKPGKSGGGGGGGVGLKNNTWRPRNATAWPKPDKRLGDGAARKSPQLQLTAAATTAANQTDGSVVVADFKARYPVDMWKDHGFYMDDYMQLINSHWFKFEPPNALSHYILGTLYAILMAFGCSGNFLVIFMYIKCKSLQTPANVLIMNLAVSDFIMLAKTPVFIYNSYYQGPTLGKLGCQVYGFFGGLTGTVSIMTLAAISLDRYYVIVHPLNAAVKTTKQRARAWIGLIWLYGFSFSVVPVLDAGYNRYVPEGYLTSCSFDYLTDDGREKAFILVFFAAAWCVPFATIAYCYVWILRAVWTTGQMAAGSRFGQEEEKRKTEVRLGYVVVGVIVLWFLSWTPYAVVALLGVFGRTEYVTPLGSMVPALFCKAASCMDPWIYAITHPRFKNELTKLLSRNKTRKLERDNGVMKKGGGGGGWSHSASRSAGGGGGDGGGLRNQSSTEDEDVDEVIVMVDDPDDGRDSNKVRRQGSTSSHRTAETRALETRFPPTRQESLKYMPPSWYKSPRASSKSSIKVGDGND